MADGPAATAARVLFMGMTGSFSLPPLEALQAASITVCGVFVPAQPRRTKGGPHLASPSPTRTAKLVGEELRVLTPYVERSIVHLAWEHSIPVYEVGDLQSPDALQLVRHMRPDVLAVACFDRLVPPDLRDMARLAVNVHPSLLPENRGPAPLFWTFRMGLRKTGVTVHALEDRADAGPILAQSELPIPEGIDGAQLDRRLAELGGELLPQVIRQFAAGTLEPRRQDESRATSHGSPMADDWNVPSDWPARRAFNFIRGVAHMGGPLRVAGVAVEDAVNCDEGAQLGATPRQADGLLQVQMSSGVLTVRARH